MIVPARFLKVKPPPGIAYEKTLSLEAEWERVPPQSFRTKTTRRGLRAATATRRSSTSRRRPRSIRDENEPGGGVLRRLPHDGRVPDERLPRVPPRHEGMAMRRPILLRACATALLLFGNPCSPAPSVRTLGVAGPGGMEGGVRRRLLKNRRRDDAFRGRIEGSGRTVRQIKGRIEAQDESTRKVYLRRLQMCRDLYQYVLENKEQK